jgi:molybdopterin-guanine dinucleotide biosynthesis protein A
LLPFPLAGEGLGEKGVSAEASVPPPLPHPSPASGEGLKTGLPACGSRAGGNSEASALAPLLPSASPARRGGRQASAPRSRIPGRQSVTSTALRGSLLTTPAITGLVLAGGRGTRMGGVDKGLQPHRGLPLARHALERLRPQVGALLVNANRHLDTYRAWGVGVVADAQADFAGPLAGMLAGLEAAQTPWLVTVPCDTPGFPADLVARLTAAAQEEDTDVAIAATHEADGSLQPQPVFCLLRTALAPSLRAFLDAGQRKIDRWTVQHRCATVIFDDADAFFNANTLDELAALQREG